MYAPKEEGDFWNVFSKWLRQFVNLYLIIKPSTLQKKLFYIEWGDTTKKLNPDISGLMTQSIEKASTILKC